MSDNSPLDKAIGKMLLALGGRPEPERIMSFVDALDDHHLCGECATKAARKMSSNLKRRPFPNDLVEMTRTIQDSAEHQSHLSDRMALGSNELRVWWTTQAPVYVRKVWAELTSAQAVDIAKQMEQFGYVDPTEEAVAIELGYIDEYGPTPEREWWLENHPDLGPAPAPVPSMPRGDE